MARERSEQDVLATKQPLSEAQVHEYREYIKERGRQTWTWEGIPVGPESERVWERTFTIDSSMWYADTVEDYSGWYEAGVAIAPDDKKGTDSEVAPDSPFGGPIVPPMMIRYVYSAEVMRRLNIIGGIMMITFHDTQILKPVLAGSKLRFTAHVSRKFVKRGRRYCTFAVEVVDVGTGEAVIRDYHDMLMGYRKVDD